MLPAIGKYHNIIGDENTENYTEKTWRKIRKIGNNEKLSDETGVK